jgi:hypothetical protein
MFLLDIDPSTRPSPSAMSRDAFEERARAAHTEFRLVLALANCLAAEHTGWVFVAAASASLHDCRAQDLAMDILIFESKPCCANLNLLEFVLLQLQQAKKKGHILDTFLV